MINSQKAVFSGITLLSEEINKSIILQSLSFVGECEKNNTKLWISQQLNTTTIILLTSKSYSSTVSHRGTTALKASTGLTILDTGEMLELYP